MGVGLVAYRVAIGRFAEFARRHRSKSKLPKATKGRKDKAARIETAQNFATHNFTRRWASLDRLKRGGKSKENGRRSETLDPQMFTSRNIKNRKMSSLRDRSHSRVRRGGTTLEMMKRDLRDACALCKTNWFDQKCSRGRRKVRGAGLKREKCCSQSWRESTNDETHRHSKWLHLLTCFAVSECILLEYAGIVQMLLLMSGIERNPGPTPSTASCCKAGQHFNRVNNTKRKVLENFQSKVEQNTMTDPVIKIEETGKLNKLEKSVLYRYSTYILILDVRFHL